MANELTVQQRVAVENRGGKLLVSAAAGSGKTKVLVDRLMLYILDSADPANIDDFLIITFTKAAAAELRSKIAEKLSERIAEDPENQHLRHQMQRLYLAKISTVHGFCTDLLRQYAYRLDITSDFRVAEENECLELQLRAMDRTLEEAYENADANPDFCAFIDTQGLGRDDRQIPQIILEVYKNARCHLNPDGWLNWCTAENFVSASGIEQTPWGEYLIDDLKSYLSRQIEALSRCVQAAETVPELEKPASLIASTVAQLRKLYACKTWDEIVCCREIDYGTLRFPAKCSDMQTAGKIKAVRNACKEGLEKRLSKFADKSAQILADIPQITAAARGLVELTQSFAKNYTALKKSRGIVDFGDLEHYALDLLLGKQRTGPTAIAAEAGACFREVMVDEYQDTNEIQDAIFGALTQKRQNCFMVGDVKQSIYQFRLADPGIFIDKYNTYCSAEEAKAGEGRRVLLNDNFRSSSGIIEAVNYVFKQCMSPKVGGLHYGEAEMLREGKPHISLLEPEVSLIGIETDSDKTEEEANVVANKICSMLNGNHFVRDGDALRPIKPDDIVILLRNPGSVGSDYQYALQSRGIRCHKGDKENFLLSEEVSMIRAFLEIINNPLQDIPLTAVLSSPVFGFTADDLAQLRAKNRKTDMYRLIATEDHKKCRDFMHTFTQLRQQAKLLGVTELISEIYTKTNLLSIYSAMPGGEEKLENLQNFFQTAVRYEGSGPKEISRFLEYLEALEAKGVGGDVLKVPGAVTILSIHKSKGLEFPVVFLCGLSTSFNMENTKDPVLCDKDLGLGLGCADNNLRLRYPSLMKRAISTKMHRDALSEELRILYVAMTRARDRLIMTYADRKLSDTLQEISMQLDLSGSINMACEADCLGSWVLQAALTRTDAGAFFAYGGHPDCVSVPEIPWEISVIQAGDSQHQYATAQEESVQAIDLDIPKLSAALSFRYRYSGATGVPSKLTATQLKGRNLDSEVADGCCNPAPVAFRHIGKTQSAGTAYGNAYHTLMQHIEFAQCGHISGIVAELERLVEEKLIDLEQAALIDCEKISAFFQSSVGEYMRQGEQIIREFKFSVLEDAAKFFPNAEGEKVLFQGVVDCARIDEDGITIIDFKTDFATEATLHQIAARYTEQVSSYAQALSRIYGKPVKKATLYFFSLGKFVDVPI